MVNRWTPAQTKILPQNDPHKFSIVLTISTSDLVRLKTLTICPKVPDCSLETETYSLKARHFSSEDLDNPSPHNISP
jgi:hypothetical protein